MLNARVVDNRLHVGERFSVTFQRTLRIPDDDRAYPLPPGLGSFPIHRVADFADRVPHSWREAGGLFIPMYQREALWLSFSGARWKPNAVKIGIGRVNAVSGHLWDLELHSDPQDYVVIPEQPWLDGINAGDGFIRQFVAMPLGAGYTVEAQVTGKETCGGIQLLVYEPKPGRFPDQPPPPQANLARRVEACVADSSMGLGAGGKMTQKIYPDRHGLKVWDAEQFGSVTVHIVNSRQYTAITGEPAPPSPVSAAAYTQYGFPWFELYDEAYEDLPPVTSLSQVRTVREIDAERGHPPANVDQPFEVPPKQIRTLHPKHLGSSPRDGVDID